MTAPVKKCERCHGTGHTGGDGYHDYLDCTYCDVAAERTAFNKAFWSEHKDSRLDDQLWRAYQLGKAAASAQLATATVGALRQESKELPTLDVAARNVVAQFNDPHVSLASVARYVNELEATIAHRAANEVIVSSDKYGPILEIHGFTYTVHREITPDQIERLSRNAANVVESRVSRALKAHLKGGVA